MADEVIEICQELVDMLYRVYEVLAEDIGDLKSIENRR